MIAISIPPDQHLQIKHVVLDVNGTIAFDGNLLPGVAPLILGLRESVEVHMLTANTHGKQEHIDRELGFSAHIIQHGRSEKAQYVQRLGPQHVVAIGNGAIDAAMCEMAALGIAVIGGEGAATSLIVKADIVVNDICDALDLVLNPNRVRATLRK